MNKKLNKAIGDYMKLLRKYYGELLSIENDKARLFYP